MTDRDQAFQAIERLGNEEGWTAHKKGGARAQWKAKHQPETINRRTNPQAPRGQVQARVNINMTLEEFRQAQIQHQQQVQLRREAIINQIQRLQQQLQQLDEQAPMAMEVQPNHEVNELPEGEVQQDEIPVAEPVV